MLIGLTGGIGSGKSTVSKYLSEHGCTIVDADQIARLVVEPGSEALEEIKKVFGAKFLTPDGRLDRKKLGRLVFANKKMLAKLQFSALIESRMQFKLHLELLPIRRFLQILKIKQSLQIQSTLLMKQLQKQQETQRK